MTAHLEQHARAGQAETIRLLRAEVEQLRQILAAESDTEFCELIGIKARPPISDPRDAEIVRLTTEVEAWRAKLVEALAREMTLRVALQRIAESDYFEGEWPIKVARDALSKPT